MSDPESTNVETDTAYHEAGHIVVGLLLGRVPVSATILREGHAAGKTEFDPGVPPFAKHHLNQSLEKRKYTEQRVIGELAGSMALDLFKPGRQHDASDTHDLDFTKELISELVSWQEPDTYFKEALDRTKNLLSENWHIVEVVAKALLEHKTLSREMILDLAPAA
jgi:ATP-dependent Zn protease